MIEQPHSDANYQPNQLKPATLDQTPAVVDLVHFYLAHLKSTLFPNNFHKALQKLDVNLESRSYNTIFSAPNKPMMLEKKRFAYSGALSAPLPLEHWTNHKNSLNLSI